MENGFYMTFYYIQRNRIFTNISLEFLINIQFVHEIKL